MKAILILSILLGYAGNLWAGDPVKEAKLAQEVRKNLMSKDTAVAQDVRWHLRNSDERHAPVVAKAVLEALTAAYQPDSPGMNDDVAPARQFAIEYLSELPLPPEGMTAVLSLSLNREQDDNVRTQTARTLGKAGHLPKSVIEQLETTITDDMWPQVQIEALKVYAKQHGKSAEDGAKALAFYHKLAADRRSPIAKELPHAVTALGDLPGAKQLLATLAAAEHGCNRFADLNPAKPNK